MFRYYYIILEYVIPNIYNIKLTLVLRAVEYSAVLPHNMEYYGKTHAKYVFNK